MPTLTQAAVYSATLSYLNAVKTAGTTDPDKVMDELHKTKVNDVFAEGAPSVPTACSSMTCTSFR